jgi:hypothetical protein
VAFCTLVGFLPLREQKWKFLTNLAFGPLAPDFAATAIHGLG